MLPGRSRKLSFHVLKYVLTILFRCGADEARLQRVLEADTEKKIKAVMVVHNETTTGVTSDIKKVREAMDAAGHEALLMVDSVSGLGACDLQFDNWRVDLCVTGSQKVGVPLTLVQDVPSSQGVWNTNGNYCPCSPCLCLPAWESYVRRQELLS